MSTPLDQSPSGLGAYLLGMRSGGQPGLGASLAPPGDDDDQLVPAIRATPQDLTPPANPRSTDDNVQALAKVLTAECGPKLCTPQELQAVGSTVINRMNRKGTDSVADVVGHHQYAIAKQADPGLAFMASRLLSGQLGDNTGGATHFYSPRSMPMDGQETAGKDVGGGLEQIAGHASQNYRPGWAKTYPQKQVDGVRDWFFKLYTEPGNHL